MKYVAKPLTKTADISRSRADAREMAQTAAVVIVFCLLLYAVVTIAVNYFVENISGETEVALGNMINTLIIDAEEAIDKVQIRADEKAEVHPLQQTQAIMKKLIANESLRDLEYRIVLIDDSTPNAYAALGGLIVVSEGLLATLTSEAGLAFVLAHELAHHQKRHVVRGFSYSLVLLLLASLVGLQDNALLQSGFSFSQAQYSQQLEKEADLFAVNLLYPIYGYQPDNYVELFTKIKEHETNRKLGWFHSHPITAERINYIQQALQQQKQESVPIDAAGLSRFSIVIPHARAAMVAYRKQKVAAIAHLNLYPQHYDVLAGPVFQQVRDQAPWTRSAGFYVSNPQLLIITTPPSKTTPISYWAGEGNAAGEQSIVHNSKHKQSIIRYRDVSANHWFGWVYNKDDDVLQLALSNANARDAGYAYGMVDLPRSDNIDEKFSGSIVREPIDFKGYYHYGSNVDANNYSPYDARSVLQLQAIAPTTIPIKLWRDNPTTPQQTADWTYIIEVAPNPNAADYDVIGDKE